MMKKALVLATLVFGLLNSTSAFAFYSQCLVNEDGALYRMPGGEKEPRLSVSKGSFVNIRAANKNWYYVIIYYGSAEAEDSPSCADYGWLPKSALGRCFPMEGTP